MPKLCPRPNCRRGGRRDRADSVPLGHTRPLLFAGCCRGDMAGGDGAEGGVTAEPDGGRSPEHQPPHTNPTSSTSRFAAPPPACCPSVPCPAPRLSQGFGLAGAQHQRSAPVSMPGATAGCSHKATGTQQSAGQGAVPPAEPPAPPSWVLPQPAVLPWGLQHPCVPGRARQAERLCAHSSPLCPQRAGCSLFPWSMLQHRPRLGAGSQEALAGSKHGGEVSAGAFCLVISCAFTLLTMQHFPGPFLPQVRAVCATENIFILT